MKKLYISPDLEFYEIYIHDQLLLSPDDESTTGVPETDATGGNFNENDDPFG